jgi:hypothetical protein
LYWEDTIAASSGAAFSILDFKDTIVHRLRSAQTRKALISYSSTDLSS